MARSNIIAVLNLRYLIMQQKIANTYENKSSLTKSFLYYLNLNPMDGGAWQAAVHVVAKSRTGLSDFPFTFHFHALKKEMATHSSDLAWRIPGSGSLVGCRLWGHTESDTTEVTQRQQQQYYLLSKSLLTEHFVLFPFLFFFCDRFSYGEEYSERFVLCLKLNLLSL